MVVLGGEGGGLMSEAGCYFGGIGTSPQYKGVSGNTVLLEASRRNRTRPSVPAFITYRP
jgi:hypothetical protein